MPVNMNKVVLKIILLRSNVYNNCNNDFAIDDILFSPTGPTDQNIFMVWIPELPGDSCLFPG